jgi:hypothetical protein
LSVSVPLDAEHHRKNNVPGKMLAIFHVVADNETTTTNGMTGRSRDIIAHATIQNPEDEITCQPANVNCS